MSNVAVLRSDRTEADKAALYLGPAEIVDLSPGTITVRLPSGARVEARPALGFGYEPAVGDVVLVISQGEGSYVIGVLEGTGKTTLALPGDVDLRAVGGVLRLRGDKGIEVDAPELELRAGKLRMLAGAVVQRFSSLRQQVRDLLSVHAGESHQVVDGAAYSQSKSATLLTEEKVSINGKEIFLG
jgi:hypothetical protein